MTIKDVLDLGTTGILAVGVWALWMRLNTVTDRFLDYKEQSDAERKVIASQVGLDTVKLAELTAQVRKARDDER